MFHVLLRAIAVCYYGRVMHCEAKIDREQRNIIIQKCSAVYASDTDEVGL